MVVVNGRVYLEVHRDSYRRGVDAPRLIADFVGAQGVRVDAAAVEMVIRRRDGIARDVTALSD